MTSNKTSTTSKTSGPAGKTVHNQILMATRNAGKIQELKQLLQDIKVEVLTLAAFPQVPEVEETGMTFLENATLKAVSAAQASGLLALADDSGLEVDVLGGQPGVHSSRFAGEPCDDQRNNMKLLQLLQGVAAPERAARFISVIAIATPEGSVFSAEGSCEGIILEELKGQGGFGYDPLFYVPSLGKTYAEMTLEEKNRISHRGIALRKAAAIIRRLLITGS